MTHYNRNTKINASLKRYWNSIHKPFCQQVFFGALTCTNVKRTRKKESRHNFFCKNPAPLFGQMWRDIFYFFISLQSVCIYVKNIWKMHFRYFTTDITRRLHNRRRHPFYGCSYKSAPKNTEGHTMLTNLCTQVFCCCKANVPWCEHQTPSLEGATLWDLHQHVT